MPCGTTNEVSKVIVDTGSTVMSFFWSIFMFSIVIAMFLIFFYFIFMCFGDYDRPIKVI